MVADLVREFAPLELVADADFSGLQRVNSKFYFKRRSGRWREADVIWMLPTRAGRGFYFYLLIEFQSEIDPWMAVRGQVYQGLLWQQVIDERKLEADMGLPALLVLVLYNGEGCWTAATTTSELIPLAPDSTLWQWQPRVRYCLLDMGRIPNEELARRSSLVALLFRLEQSHSPEGLRTLLEEVIGWFRKHPGCERLQALFTELIRDAFARHGMSLPGIVDLSEVKSMLTIDFEPWKRRWVAEGKAEGKAAGKAEALICFLVARFGTVPPSWRKLIEEAEVVTLERWLERAGVAPDLPSVFNPPR